MPKHYRDYSTRSVLTMDWIEGVHISEALRSNPGDVEPLVRVGIQCYLTQLLHTGFFHGDPHSGNLIVMSNGACPADNLCAAVIRTNKFEHTHKHHTHSHGVA